MDKEKISVVICTRNEEARIKDCLESVVANHPHEIILVDGGSTDRTLQIAAPYVTKTIANQKSSLSRDRQVGIDACRNSLIAMIDADHRLQPGDLDSLVKDLREFKFDVVQSQLVPVSTDGFWNSAEADAWDLIHNVPGPRAMIGTAPAVYRKEIFGQVRFDDAVTATIDDTDFIYRLSKVPGLTYGIGRTKIHQVHFANLDTYLKKFKWYGKGDGEFCRKHPNRAASMVFHLAVRYPLVYSARACARGKFRAVPFFILQGFVRLYGLGRFLLTH